ncbi:MAG: hypothetical protein Q8L57_00405, partial [bacterium]|nr:hypothetical protein [bacterium]
FFIAPLYHILAVLFFGGLIALIFFSRRAGPDSDFLNTTRLVSVFLWLADIFGLVSFGTLNFTLGIFLVFLIGFFALWTGLTGQAPHNNSAPARPALLGEAREQVRYTGQGRRRIIVFSFGGGLILAEFFWVLNFLPFGFLTLGGIAFVIFYLIWIILYYYFRDNLSRQIILKNAVFSAALILILLLTTKWQP